MTSRTRRAARPRGAGGSGRGRVARWAAAWAGAGLAGVLASAPATAGAAAPGRDASADERPAVVLSVDGHSWSRSLAVPLLDPERVWVPGDVERTRLLVRNDGPSDARANLAVTLDGDPELVQALEVQVRTGGGRGDDGGPAPFALGRGVVQPVELEVAFDPRSGNETQGSTVRLGVSVVLEGAPDGDVGEPSPADAPPPGAGSPPPDGGDSAALPPDGLLPRTGGDTGRLVALAAAALAGGAALRATRRDRGGTRA